MSTQVQKKRIKSQKNTILSILKSKKVNETRNRKDRSGNDIIHGGNYKITFQDSFVVLKTNSYTPQNEFDNYSESEQSEVSESEVSQIQGQNSIPHCNQIQETVPQAPLTNCDLEIKIETDQRSPQINSQYQSKKISQITQKSHCCITF